MHELRRAAFGLALLVTGCTTPRTAVEQLGELYVSRDAGRAKYAAEVTDRGIVATTRQNLQSIFGAPTSEETEKLDQPVSFALDSLALVAGASARELDRLERAAALAIVLDMARVDPARVVRAKSFLTAATLWRSLHDEGAATTTRFEVQPVDEKKLDADLDPLIELGGAPSEKYAALVAQPAKLLASAQALGAQRPGRFELTQKLLLLAAKCGRIVVREQGPAELVAAFEQAAVALAGQAAFLAARPDFELGQGALDPWTDCRIGATALLFAVDPIAATVELGGKTGQGGQPSVWERALEPLVRTAWLMQLHDAGIGAANVHPSLRTVLVQELDDEDAAVAYWTRRTLAALLAVDEEKTSRGDLQAKWLALGEWEATAIRR